MFLINIIKFFFYLRNYKVLFINARDKYINYFSF